MSAISNELARVFVLTGAVFNLVIVGTSRALADEPTPTIRQFDIPTIESLGAAMYVQDQEAWKATDVLTAQYSAKQLKAAKVHGWIVDTRGNSAVVRFVRDSANGPEIFCNVNFAQDSASNCTDPLDRALDPDELAQYNARLLALQNIDHPCSDTYNTVALKEPQSDDWLVWAIAATKTDRDAIILGGHYRFTISSDGMRLQQKDALSRTCQRFSRTKGPNGENADIITTQIVSLTPVETYVFASLSYKIPLRIGTDDGKAWKVDGTSITNIDMDMPGIDGFAARALASFDEKCFAIVSKSTNQNANLSNVPIKSVIESTESGKEFAPDISPDNIVRLIGCSRNDFALAPNDYKILFAGFPFMIVDNGTGHPHRAGTLYIEKGRFSFRTEKGDQPTLEQLAHINARLDAFQNIQQNK